MPENYQPENVQPESDQLDPAKKQLSADELKALLSGLAQNDLDDAGMTRLISLLSESEEARWAYIHSVHLSEGVKRWCRSQGETDIWAVVDRLRQSNNPQDIEIAAELEVQAIDDALLAREGVAGQQTRAARRQSEMLGSELQSSRWKRWSAVVIAASLLVAIALQQRNQMSDADLNNGGESIAELGLPYKKLEYALSDSEHVVARVTSMTGDISWYRGQEPQDFLMRFRPGDIVGVEKGLIQLEFSAGALLVVESPSILQVTSATSARLLQGRVVGRADSGNFTLLTPTASVVDIGTEFGVGVSRGSTDVTVFEGEVHVHPLLGSIDSASMQKLLRGMSVRVDSHGLSNSRPLPNQESFQRRFDQATQTEFEKNSASLLDLLSGGDTSQQQIAGSIDPKTGYWGRPPWLDPQQMIAQRGDTQFTQTKWNPMVDGVFIPRSNAREMQIDSDAHMVYLPPNTGSTWGPIWARRRFDLAQEQALLANSERGFWGAGALSSVVERLRLTSDGLMGMHANVGITFDLNAVRKVRSQDFQYFKAVVANLDSSSHDDPSHQDSIVDLRIFVDGRLRYSRLQFGRSDGEAPIIVLLSKNDRFLTIVTTDADGDPDFDQVVLIDPVLEYAPPPPHPDRA